ncbi:zinc-binding dehydrogenase [Pseudonocardia sp. DSM 110487]|nr:zinc-binding dehydrogenase [Pseudonocardia sp. DSM 110487]
MEVPAPAAGDLRPGEVLVAVEHGGICGSDLPYFRAGGQAVAEGGRPAGAPPGFPLHEIVGRVHASRDPGVVVGERVVGWASAADALAELVVTAGSGLHPIADGRRAQTVVAQPLACVLYAVDQLGDLRGSRVAVLGLGSIGLLLAWALHRRGAAAVIGVDPVDRTAHAAAFGLDDVLVTASGPWAASLGAGDRPDVIVEAVGHQTATVADAVRAVADGGTIYCFGIPRARGLPDRRLLPGAAQPADRGRHHPRPPRGARQGPRRAAGVPAGGRRPGHGRAAGHGRGRCFRGGLHTPRGPPQDGAHGGLGLVGNVLGQDGRGAGPLGPAIAPSWLRPSRTSVQVQYSTNLPPDSRRMSWPLNAISVPTGAVAPGSPPA